MTSLVLDKLVPPLPTTARATPIVLGSSPNSENFLYCNKGSVVIMNIKDPSISRLCQVHQSPVTCANYSLNGNYIASGDQQGKVIIWADNKEEIIKKYDHKMLANDVRDVSWSPDGNKIITVGSSCAPYAKLTAWDSSNTNTNVSYSSKVVNSCHFSPIKPFRACVASDDQSAYFYSGMKLENHKQIKKHTGFVQCCRFTPDGQVFLTGSSDSKVFVFNGDDGQFLREMTPSHKGGIYAIAPSADSRQILTASGDKTASIYDIETGQLVQSYRLGSEIKDMQLGCLWQHETLITVSLSGFINYLDINDTSKPCRIIQGQQKAFTCAIIRDDDMFLGSFDGRISKYDISGGRVDVVDKKGPAGINSLVSYSQDMVASFSMDNSTFSFYGKTLKANNWDCPLPSTPFHATSDGEDVVVACQNNIIFYRGESLLASMEVKEAAICCDISTKVGHFACTLANTTIYQIPTNDKFVTVKTFSQPLLRLKYSPDGKYLAGVDDKFVVLFSVPEYEKVGKEYFGNSSSVVSLSWSPSSTRFMTASIDSSVLIWEVGRNRGIITMARAHGTNPLVSALFVKEDKVASVGSDTSIKLWNIQ